jgi:S-adenosylmethionine:tRNA ribosyltransferase-isomerase
MRVDDFDYPLPPELIAQHPAARRDGSRLLRLSRADGAISHHGIAELPALLPGGALLVVNDSRVIPARLWARRPTGGRVEVLLLEREAHPDEIWVALLRASKGPRAGERLAIEARGGVALPPPALEVLEPPQAGRARVRVHGEPGALLAHGVVPLPPYLRRQEEPGDRERYQTVYARHDGSVAAPTAGLHFTAGLLAELERAGIERATVTLHVGPGTFLPVRADSVEEHRMESERFRVPEETADAIARAKRERRPVVAVGTTSVRTLEASGGAAGEGRTNIFIRPGHTFAVVDALLTNFHLPRSTLLMLVSAFAGRERVLEAYRQAVAERYRFYSYGDAMLIV